jgi:hypothetical protein
VTAADLGPLVAREDHAALVAAARRRAGRVLRYLTGRLYTEAPAEKARVVRALGAVFGDDRAVDGRRATDTLRRYLWSLNDESGAVPYGIPEAIGEILAVRPELQGEFLPILGSMLTHEDMTQTGSIEHGVIWALGRVGPGVASIAPEAVRALARLAVHHPDAEARSLARASLARIAPASPGPLDPV